MTKYSINKPITKIKVLVNSSKVKEKIKKLNKDGNVSIGELIVYGLSEAIKEFPEFNSNYDKSLILKESQVIYFPMNLGKGTVSLILKNVENLTVYEISKQIKELALKAIHGEIVSEEIEPTFTLTNLYPLGITDISTPLYESHSSVLSTSLKEPEKEDFELNLCFDSRISDCNNASKFLIRIKEIIEKSD